ncbi:MAG: ASPIC/UnbV domain-containing protein, partial [Thermoanaerobaculia bacterium]
NTNHWLTVVPLLADGETVAVGSTVTVIVGSMQLVHPVHGVSGYLSASDPRPHFGLGAADRADRVEIHWPDGQQQLLEAVPANQILEVVQSAK